MLWTLLLLLLNVAANSVKAQYASECVAPHERRGRCMPVYSCKNILALFARAYETKAALSSAEEAFLRQSFCGTYGNEHHVCCDESEIQLNTKGWNILNGTACGMYSRNKVSNGQMAALFEFPWMALLKYSVGRPFRCGGSLISDRYVLTAAHCVHGFEDIVKEVRLGEHNIASEVDCNRSALKTVCAPPVEDIGIEKIIQHPGYGSKQIHHDIALLRLGRQVGFKRHIKPICLPLSPELRSQQQEAYIISGWGRTEKDVSSDVLMVAVVQPVERDNCRRRLGLDGLTEAHICAGSDHFVDTCRGDSGGPLGFRGRLNNHVRFVQFGVVSLGVSTCGRVNAPGVYTNVSHYMQWITDNIKS